MAKKGHLTTYSRRWTVVGAFIVFVTFLVKDAIRENVKDTVDSLQSADYQFVLASETAVILTMSNDIQESVDGISHRLTASSGTLGDELDDIERYVVQDVATLMNLKKMIEKLPEKETSLRDSLQQLDARRESLLENMKKLEEQLKAKNALINDKVLTDEEDESVHDQLSSLGEESETLLSDIGNLSGKAVDRAGEIKHEEERKLQIYTWISYALYAIGWSMALFGRLHGVEPVDGLA